MYKIILTIVYLITVLILLGCSCYLVEHGKRRTEVIWYVISLGCVQIWCLSQILIFVSKGNLQMLISYMIGNIGICLVGSSWLNFSLLFGQKMRIKWLTGLTIAFSTLMYILILTNPLHHKYYKKISNGNVLYGKLFYINIIYDYICVLIGVYIIWKNIPKKKGIMTIKFVLSVSVVIPLISNYIYQVYLNNLQYDLTPIGFSISCTLVLLITFKMNIFDLKLKVFNEFIDNMQDGIVIFTTNNKLIYINESAEEIFKSVDTNEKDYYEILMGIFDEKQKNELNENSETLYLSNISGKYLIQKYFYSNDTDQIMGMAFIFRDISKYYDLEKKKRDLIMYKQKNKIEQERNRIVQIIHDSLVSEGIIQLCENVTEIDTEVTIQGEDKKKYAYLSRNLYESFRETITNTLRYGKASKLETILRFSENEVTMFVFDNGVGCSNLNKGRGLNGIIRRTEYAGGNVKFITRKDEGFQTIITLPLENKNMVYMFK